MQYSTLRTKVQAVIDFFHIKRYNSVLRRELNGAYLTRKNHTA